MTASLHVDLNGSGLHDVEAPEEFTVTGPFTVDLVNHGEAVHTHLNLDDQLSRVARLQAGNHYVEAGATRPVQVDVREVSEPRTGKLKVVTGYGARTHYVDVTVAPPVERTAPVDVDETLSKPRQPEPSSSPLDPVRDAVDDSALPVVVLGALAVLLALAVGVFANSVVVLVASIVVILGVVAAVGFAVS